jgi:hypothetical protein
MKLFKIYLIIFAIVIGVIVVSRFFPSTYFVERSITINKPVTQTFAYMSNLKNWEQWSLWNKSVDSTLFYFYNNKFDTLGARQYFRGELLGRGVFEVDSFVLNQLLHFTLVVDDGDRTAAGTLLFKPLTEQTTSLHWIDSGDVGNNPLKRFMIPVVTKNTEQTLDAGLASIKKQLEQ